ncbi:hypothetical protein OIU91_09660 [Streptomyces sp. NBC_01456]|uniref:hypothetical protein n=1 Tax=unclassified Streptomyces TaxID=2593676 RepID=UPI002E2F17AE|nr:MULTISPECIES: hypothetical protein [unclassified Streptomyces]
MPDWFNRKALRWERQLAWRAQVAVATRAPFLKSAHGVDPDSHIGEVVYDSKAVITALREPATGINPSRQLVPTLIEAAAAVTKLGDLWPSWIDYCNGRSKHVHSTLAATTEECRCAIQAIGDAR